MQRYRTPPTAGRWIQGLSARVEGWKGGRGGGEGVSTASGTNQPTNHPPNATRRTACAFMRNKCFGHCSQVQGVGGGHKANPRRMGGGGGGVGNGAFHFPRQRIQRQTTAYLARLLHKVPRSSPLSPKQTRTQAPRKNFGTREPRQLSSCASATRHRSLYQILSHGGATQ